MKGLTVKELYDWAVEHDRENDVIAVECGGLLMGEDMNIADEMEFQGLASIVDDRLDTYFQSRKNKYKAVWLCCSDGELYRDTEDRSSVC